MRTAALILSFLVNVFCFSQDMRYIDSLLNSLTKKSQDSVRSSVYSLVSHAYHQQDNVKAFEYGKLSWEYAKKTGMPKRIWVAMNRTGEALRSMGNLEEAIKVHQEALSLATANNFNVKAGHSCNNLALIYKRSDNYVKAKEYFAKALSLYKEEGFTDGFYTVYNNLGNLFYRMEYPDSALYNFRLAYRLIGGFNDSSYYAQNANNMAMVFYYLGQRDSALYYYERAFAVNKRFGSVEDIANSGINLGATYVRTGDPHKGKKLLMEMLVLAKKSGNNNEMADAMGYLAQALFACGDYKNAYLYLDTSQKFYDKILGEEQVRALNEASEKYGAEKKQLQINQLNTENAAKEALLEEGRKTKLYMALGLGCVILFSIYLFYTVKQRDKTNRIINEQKKEVEQQKALIEVHQKETLDSINYAKRIQYSLLAHEALLKEHLKEYFVLFKPKDIVSGDFYWATTAGNKFYLAVCDSTGHGVPGAFMSLLNINFMNEAINEKKIHEPNEVFNHVRKSLIQNVSQDGQRDGMDGILACFDKGKLTYASANNAPVVISGEQLIEFPKDKMPVGAGERDASFNLHELNVKKGDVVYLYTDGFADQFGGDKGKKFKYKQLNELLLSISKLPLTDQKQKLERAFDAWKGSLEQVDDVCIIGIRI